MLLNTRSTPSLSARGPIVAFRSSMASLIAATAAPAACATSSMSDRSLATSATKAATFWSVLSSTPCCLRWPYKLTFAANVEKKVKKGKHDQISIAGWMREERLSRNLTQAQLAQMLNVSPAAIASWESGARTAKPTTVARLKQILAGIFIQKAAVKSFTQTLERSS